MREEILRKVGTFCQITQRHIPEDISYRQKLNRAPYFPSNHDRRLHQTVRCGAQVFSLKEHTPSAKKYGQIRKNSYTEIEQIENYRSHKA
jgi:hypothetical protein